MRIADEWNHEGIKVTAMIMNGRYSIKLETGLLEQWYKFRDGQFESVQELKSYLNDDFYKNAILVFESLMQNRQSILKQQNDSLEFDVII